MFSVSGSNDVLQSALATSPTLSVRISSPSHSNVSTISTATDSASLSSIQFNLFRLIFERWRAGGILPSDTRFLQHYQMSNNSTSGSSRRPSTLNTDVSSLGIEFYYTNVQRGYMKTVELNHAYGSEMIHL
jgi:hypothetical protein